MDTAELRDLVEFSDREPFRRTIFETGRLWAQLVCVGRNQSHGPVSDPDADAVVTIVAGEAVCIVDRRRKRLGQWGTALVPAGSELQVTNASGDPLVLLVVTAPPPGPGG